MVDDSFAAVAAKPGAANAIATAALIVINIFCITVSWLYKFRLERCTPTRHKNALLLRIEDSNAHASAFPVCFYGFNRGAGMRDCKNGGQLVSLNIHLAGDTPTESRH